MSDPNPDPAPNAARKTWMAVLARAPAETLHQAGAAHLPAYTRLRGPELGLVMLQGRTGGTGPAFNLGEATIARCTVRSEAGQVGHAYCLGRDLRQAELAAARTVTARRAAATQVQFFTLATMRS